MTNAAFSASSAAFCLRTTFKRARRGAKFPPVPRAEALRTCVADHRDLHLALPLTIVRHDAGEWSVHGALASYLATAWLFIARVSFAGQSRIALPVYRKTGAIPHARGGCSALWLCEGRGAVCVGTLARCRECARGVVAQAEGAVLC